MDSWSRNEGLLSMSNVSFQELVAVIHDIYLRSNGKNCPWDSACGRNLKLAMARLRDWTLDDFRSAIQNKFDSDEVQSQSPKFWLGRIEDYLSSPLDRFHIP